MAYNEEKETVILVNDDIAKREDVEDYQVCPKCGRYFKCEGVFNLCPECESED